MSHVEAVKIDFEKVYQDAPITQSGLMMTFLWIAFIVGMGFFVLAVFTEDPVHVWSAYFTNLIYWMGLSAGAVMTAVIFQIVRAKWAVPVRRVGEANVAFLPWVWFALLISFIGGEHIYSWFKTPMPGREWWMQPDFVYIRFGLLFGLLYLLMIYFVKLSIRCDVGLLREKQSPTGPWRGWIHRLLASNWQGSAVETPRIQRAMSRLAPLIVFVYAITYTMFATEMIGGLDAIWYANMFGGFNFIGNIYMGWGVLIILTLLMTSRNKNLHNSVTNQQWWDLGKLQFGFCMLWGYLFFAHYLPQWYGNLPEETQWLILRTKEFPWKGWSWVTFSMCFVVPFIMLLSDDIKRVPKLLACVSGLILLGIWAEKYVVVMPNFSVDAIPFGWVEVSIFFMFLGLYGISVLGFMSRVPYMPVGSPLARGITKW